MTQPFRRQLWAAGTPLSAILQTEPGHLDPSAPTSSGLYESDWRSLWPSEEAREKNDIYLTTAQVEGSTLHKLILTNAIHQTDISNNIMANRKLFLPCTVLLRVWQFEPLSATCLWSEECAHSPYRDKVYVR